MEVYAKMRGVRECERETMRGEVLATATRERKSNHIPLKTNKNTRRTRKRKRKCQMSAACRVHRRGASRYMPPPLSGRPPLPLLYMLGPP